MSSGRVQNRGRGSVRIQMHWLSPYGPIAKLIQAEGTACAMVQNHEKIQYIQGRKLLKYSPGSDDFNLNSRLSEDTASA